MDKSKKGDREDSNLSLSESERIIDHQIEQIRHYENRADRIIRIFVASIGLSISGVGIFLTSKNSSLGSFDSLITENKLNATASSISTQFPVSQANADMMLFFLGTAGTVFIPIIVVLYFFVGASDAWQVIQPDAPERSRRDSYEAYNPVKLQSTIDRNDEILSKKRESLFSALENSIKGFLIFLFGVFVAVVPIVMVSPVFVIFGFISLVALVFTIILEKFSVEALPTVIYAKSDFAFVLLFTSGVLSLGYSGTPGLKQAASLLILIGATIYAIYRFKHFDIHSLARYAQRTIISTFLIITGYTVVEGGTERILAPSGSLVFNSIVIMVIITAYMSFISITILIIKYVLYKSDYLSDYNSERVTGAIKRLVKYK